MQCTKLLTQITSPVGLCCMEFFLPKPYTLMIIKKQEAGSSN
jgi:hypothetical protein